MIKYSSEDEVNYNKKKITYDDFIGFLIDLLFSLKPNKSIDKDNLE